MDNKYTENDLKNAYTEGYYDGEDHRNVPWKYPDHDEAWEISETKILIDKEKSKELNDE